VPKPNAIPWNRLAAEAAAIVFSILLAFWIDAWWEQRQSLRELDALTYGLLSDFQASQVHVEEWLSGNQRTLSTATEFLDAIRRTEIGAELDVPREWILAATATPTYSPTDTSLRTAVATGQIELIEDTSLRNALAVWRQQLDDTQEDELLIREIVVGHLVPMISQQVRMARVFEFQPMLDWFAGRAPDPSGERFRMTVTPELEAALAERLYYTHFVVGGLTDIRATQAEILRTLQRYRTPAGDL